ncbi:MAG TPA: copper-binding protein [Burkholderiales bacterium]|nr:copper-binding protein [Burkholderiales bacterium]
MKLVLPAILWLMLAIASSAVSATNHQEDGQLVEGEVRKVDRDARKLTIRHGPLPQFDMPTPMTMVYQVKDPAFLDQVKAGDKIRFAAEKVGGLFTVTRIEPGK